jgi:hypothetical protein
MAKIDWRDLLVNVGPDAEAWPTRPDLLLGHETA